MKSNSPISANVLDLIGEKITKIDIVKAEEMLKLNFGVSYSKEKFALLWEMILEDGWTDYRLKETLKYFLKTKKYPNWTISDWFDYSCDVYNYAEYLVKLNENRQLNEQIEWYLINGVRVWKYKNGFSLPFEPILAQNGKKL